MTYTMEFEFDIISYLESKEIEVHHAGEKNVTEGWIEITCPFPGCPDPSWHCGINLENPFFNCWSCGEKGHVTKLIREIEQCSWQKANFIFGQIDSSPSTGFEKDVQIQIEECSLPKGCVQKIPRLHRLYLQGRGFDPDVVTNKYELSFCETIGDWRFRIIIPIYMEGRLVCYTSRDITGLRRRHKHCTNTNAVIPAKECLYNIDTVNDRAVMVEGPFDTWRGGNKFIGTFGTECTKEQINLLRKKNVKSVFILFDSKAINEANKIAEQLSKFYPYPEHVEVLELSKGDPANLSEKQMQAIRKDIGI